MHDDAIVLGLGHVPEYDYMGRDSTTREQQISSLASRFLQGRLSSGSVSRFRCRAVATFH